MADEPDTDEPLTLDCGDRPTVERGDTLLITPDVGRPYRATVVDVNGQKIRVRISADTHAPHPVGPQYRTFYGDELTEFLVRGDLLINPPERVTPCT